MASHNAQPESDQQGSSEDKIGTVRVAPEVLATIAALTALAVPGVVRLEGNIAAEVGRLIGRRRSSHGVKVSVVGNEVWVEMHLIVKADVSMHKVSRQVQDSVVQALETMVGIPVHAVDVYIEDVE